MCVCVCVCRMGSRRLSVGFLGIILVRDTRYDGEMGC